MNNVHSEFVFENDVKLYGKRRGRKFPLLFFF